MIVQNKKYGNFVFISHLTGKCATQKLFKKCGSSLSTSYGHIKKPKLKYWFVYDFSLIVSL